MGMMLMVMTKVVCRDVLVCLGVVVCHLGRGERESFERWEHIRGKRMVLGGSGRGTVPNWASN